MGLKSSTETCRAQSTALFLRDYFGEPRIVSAAPVMLPLPDLASNARKENTKRRLEMKSVTGVCSQERLQQRALPPQTNARALLANLKMLVNARTAKLAGIV